MTAKSRISAGLLLFRRDAGTLEVLLVLPGGPYFARKDEGSWTIPKGEAADGEDLLTRARIEFSEELGTEAPCGQPFPLGSVKQKGGKTVHAWAVEGDLPEDFVLRSNTFELEWPPRSGRKQSFPEIAQAQFFPDRVARDKINPAQIELLDLLITRLEQSSAT